MDKSNGYENIATIFIKHRANAENGIGTTAVRNWVRTLLPESTVLDIGCGMGIPITKTLIEEGMKVYGIDASPTMVRSFQHNFPDSVVSCEAVEDSSFFNRKFDGIIACGLMFLLSEEIQSMVIQKSANSLRTGGKLLFTAPCKITEWKDIMTGENSVSLGADKYKELLISSGLSLIEEFEDEGYNHYYNAAKI